jgi:diguanylate cyclase (GGDEF)-like protein
LRVLHYLILVAILCGAGGVFLQDRVLAYQESVQVQREAREQALLAESDVLRLRDQVEMLLLTTDLILGAQESYLVDGALRQAELIDNIASAIRKRSASPGGATSGTYDVLRSASRALAAELNAYALLPLRPDEDEQDVWLKRMDGHSARMIAAMQSLETIAAANITAAEESAVTVTSDSRHKVELSVAMYASFVLGVLLWSSRAVSKPISELQFAAQNTSDGERNFDPPSRGPAEVRSLTQHIAKLVGSLQSELRTTRAITDAIPDTLLVLDRTSGIRHVKPAEDTPAELLGLNLLGWNFLNHLSRDHADTALDKINECHTSGRSQQFEFDLTYRDTVRRFEARVSAGNDKRIVIVVRDLTDRLSNEARIKQLAYFDHLTGLMNRAYFAKQVNDILAKCNTEKASLALCFIDLDRFKVQNDSNGHEAGDRVLQRVAARITSNIRFDRSRPFTAEDQLDIAARVGGDEFVVAISGAHNRYEVDEILERLNRAIAEPISINGQDVRPSASIGVAFYPDDGITQSELFHAADIAMYEAKRSGGNTYRFYNADLGKRTYQKLSLEARLKRAIDNEQLFLEYQPQIDLGSGKVTGLEALVRWHDDEEIIFPAEFIPIAEETGLIIPLGQQVLHRAVEQATSWQRNGLEFGRIHVNVSAKQFAHPLFTSMLLEAIEMGDADYDSFGIEVTESAIMQDFERGARILADLRSRGVCIAMDDFGTGYSSLNCLKHLPLQVLKIDRSFLSSATSNRRDAKLVRTIIKIGHQFDMIVLAEGVETAAQSELLASMGCDRAQGFYLGKPRRAVDIDSFIKRASPPKLGKEIAVGAKVSPIRRRGLRGGATASDPRPPTARIDSAS